MVTAVVVLASEAVVAGRDVLVARGGSVTPATATLVALAHGKLIPMFFIAITPPIPSVRTSKNAH